MFGRFRQSYCIRVHNNIQERSGADQNKYQRTSKISEHSEHRSCTPPEEEDMEEEKEVYPSYTRHTLQPQNHPQSIIKALPR